LRESKAIQFMCGIGAVIVGLGLYSYYVRELLASLLLFSVGFIFLGVVVLGMFLIWHVSVQVAIWTRPASRNMIALSRRLVAAYARS
jgi:hypothetical protein